MVNRRTILGSMAAAGTAAALWPERAIALGDGEPSRTALGAALHRAAHQVVDKPPVFPDPLALSILGSERSSLLREYFSRKRGGTKAMRAFIIMRSRYAEDELAAAFQQGVRQYLILGAGLDTFAYRNPFGGLLKAFEVDHPATQEWKRSRLREQNIAAPAALAFVPVDFEKDSLGERLDRAGFDRNAPVFISWLGVSIYLTRDAVFETLRFVSGSCARGSRIVFDFALPDEQLGERELSIRNARAEKVAEAGEPWISYFDADALAADLLRTDFRSASSLGPDELNARYFTGRTDGLRISGSGRMMLAST
jgi:methyltransferase (TIGR00027 family)